MDSKRAEAMQVVAHKALVFGELSAKAAGPETFDDPVMHTYFLHYIYGAIAGLASHDSVPAELSGEDRVNAMGQALMQFENATRDQVMATLKMLYRAQDEAALKIQEAGREAAERWDWGGNAEAVRHFAGLLEDPEGNFPREVESSPPVSKTPPSS